MEFDDFDRLVRIDEIERRLDPATQIVMRPIETRVDDRHFDAGPGAQLLRFVDTRRHERVLQIHIRVDELLGRAGNVKHAGGLHTFDGRIGRKRFKRGGEFGGAAAEYVTVAIERDDAPAVAQGERVPFRERPRGHRAHVGIHDDEQFRGCRRR